MGNNPINYTDPTGHRAIMIDTGGGGGASPKLVDSIAKEAMGLKASGNLTRRVEQVQDFFRQYAQGEECTFNNEFGCGRAVVDFTQWEVDSNRLRQSAYWNVVNAMLVQDMLDAQYAEKMGHASSGSTNGDLWLAFAQAPSPGTFWTAHSASIQTAHNSSTAQTLLTLETITEQHFVSDVVIPAALSAGPVAMDLGGPRWIWDPSSTGVSWFVHNVYATNFPYKRE